MEIETGEYILLPSYTLDVPAEVGACPFCDSRTGLTREHVWPGWYSRELQMRGAVLAGDIVVDNHVEVTVPVCGTCNTTSYLSGPPETFGYLGSQDSLPYRRLSGLCHTSRLPS